MMDVKRYSLELGARLRQARSSARLSMSDVEEKTAGHLTAVTVGTYERGERNLPFEKLMALADLYGVPAVTLVPEIPGLKRRAFLCPTCSMPRLAAV